jgi:hypothetical protein
MSQEQVKRAGQEAKEAQGDTHDTRPRHPFITNLVALMGGG